MRREEENWAERKFKKCEAEFADVCHSRCRIVYMTLCYLCLLLVLVYRVFYICLVRHGFGME